MVVDTDNGHKYGNELEVTLKDQEDSVAMFINGFEVIVRYNDVGISIDVYDDTEFEVTPISEKQFWFENLEGVGLRKDYLKLLRGVE